MMTSADKVLMQALSKYEYADIAWRDVKNAISYFKDLLPSQDSFIFNDGSEKNILNLDGTIPVTYKGTTFNIPICVWILDTHPYNPPMVFVKPDSTMQIKAGRNVDTNGKVDLPYLRDWRYPQSDLFGLLQILALVFGEDSPVFSKQSHMAQSLTPNPGTFPHRISLPRYTHTESFQRSLPLPRNTHTESFQRSLSLPRYTHTESSPCPVSSSQYAYSGRSLYSGYNLDIFRQTMKKFALDEFVNILVEHGVGCVEAFCSMTESDFEQMGLDIEQRRKCILAAQQIKDHFFNVLESGLM
ncbi:tumor susceptibility gene 101 protein isoform X2 [Magallana gigas]|uniref:tumor susceptibility gene 101 protein isoform X2 n=1 Tax=Magallana gigas TaxID=29159 RepID=UPI0033424C1C